MFVEASLSFMGIYLLVGVLKSLLETDQAEVIIAGVLLALATILLFCLIGPHRLDALAKQERTRRGEEMRMDSPLTVYGKRCRHGKEPRRLWRKTGYPDQCEGGRVTHAATQEDSAARQWNDDGVRAQR